MPQSGGASTINNSSSMTISLEVCFYDQLRFFDSNIQELRDPLYSNSGNIKSTLHKMPKSLKLAVSSAIGDDDGGEQRQRMSHSGSENSVCSEQNQRIVRGGRSRASSTRSKKVGSAPSVVIFIAFLQQKTTFPNPPGFAPPLPPKKLASQVALSIFSLIYTLDFQPNFMFESEKVGEGDYEYAAPSVSSKGSKKQPEFNINNGKKMIHDS